MLIFVTCALVGQNNEFVSLKNFTPPSPEAAALGRYGEVPVDMSTGVPAITMPIYEIKIGKLSLPISLNYHASGIKLHDVATPVGLGWVLNAGGAISRTVVGLADEKGLLTSSMSYIDRSSLVNKRYNGTDYQYLENLSNGAWDSQSDIYAYNAGTISGRFVYDVNKQLHALPVDAQLKFSFNSDTTFTVIDDGGNIYRFAEKERTFNQTGPGFNITSWQLTAIISADRTDSVRFYYRNAADYEETYESHNYYIHVPTTINSTVNCDRGQPSVNYSFTPGGYIFKRKLVDSIAFSNGYVKFIYASDRQDLLPERLARIRVSNNRELIKDVVLSQSYFQSSGYNYTVDAKYFKRLRLDTLIYADKAATEINRTSFQYEATELPPYHLYDYTSGERINNQVDYWGYYNANGAVGVMKTMLPIEEKSQVISFLQENYYAVNASITGEYDSRSAERKVNPLTISACALKKINYPTGGYTEFEYEPNVVPNDPFSTPYRGGLRVSKMVSFDTINRIPIIKTYTYDSVIDVSPSIPRDFSYRNLSVNYPSGSAGGKCYTEDLHISANPSSPINYYNSSPVFYARVSEYEGYPGSNNGKTEYLYDFEPDSTYNAGYTAKYWNFSTDRSWARGNLLSKKIYRFEADTNLLIKETRNTYQSMGTKTVKVGELCELLTNTNGVYLPDYMNDTLTMGSPYDHRYLLTHFEYADIVLPFGVKKLVKTEEFDYLNDTLSQKRNILYQSGNHLYPTKIVSSTSRETDSLTEIMKYPQDKSAIVSLTADASQAIDAMVSGNMLSAVLEQETYRNTDLLMRKRTDFKSWSANRIYEQYHRTQQGSSAMEARIEYKSYDAKGNPILMSQYNGPDVAYIWDYDGANVTAKIAGAKPNEVAYTSFETGPQTGNWYVAGNCLDTSIALTGNRVFNLVSGYVTTNSLNAAKNYVVTYWVRGGTATVVGFDGGPVSIPGTVKKTKNGWTLYEHTVQGTWGSGATIQAGSGTPLLDELRMYPDSLQMETYTYKPLIGLLSTCSVNDVVISYEYDNAGRLKATRDDDDNIVKAIDYKYNVAQLPLSNGWRFTGVSREQEINGHKTGLIERWETDYNASSPTYNQSRWVPWHLGIDYPEWSQPTSIRRCVKNKRNENTGIEEELYRSTNPYSVYYGKYKWLSIGATGNCPTPAQICEAGNPANKWINGVCEIGRKHYTSSWYDNLTGIWHCFFYYYWSDGSSGQDLYEELSDGPCENH